MASGQKVSKVQKKGQVTIPVEIREKLGIEEGDLVAFEDTDYGVVLKPQEVFSRQDLERFEVALREQGFSFEDYCNFPQRTTEKSPKEEYPVEIEEGESIADKTFGIFESRKRPEDFKELRKLFIEGTAENVISETPPNEE